MFLSTTQPKLRVVLVEKMSSQNEELCGSVADSRIKKLIIKTGVGVEFRSLEAEQLLEHFPNYVEVYLIIK